MILLICAIIKFGTYLIKINDLKYIQLLSYQSDYTINIKYNLQALTPEDPI